MTNTKRYRKSTKIIDSTWIFLKQLKNLIQLTLAHWTNIDYRTHTKYDAKVIFQRICPSVHKGQAESAHARELLSQKSAHAGGAENSHAQGLLSQKSAHAQRGWGGGGVS